MGRSSGVQVGIGQEPGPCRGRAGTIVLTGGAIRSPRRQSATVFVLALLRTLTLTLLGDEQMSVVSRIALALSLSVGSVVSFAGGASAASLELNRILTANPFSAANPQPVDTNWPIQLTYAPGDADHLYILNRTTASVSVYDRATGTLNPTPIFTAPPELFLNEDASNPFFTTHNAYSITFDPKFTDNRTFYMSFVDKNEDLRVISAQLDTNNVPVANSVKSVITLDYQPNRDGHRHYGGDLDFGPDGMLYLTTGDNDGLTGGPIVDGAPARPEQALKPGVYDDAGIAQSLRRIEGKILRIDPHGTSIANADNNYTPAGASGGTSYVQDAIWASGLRNPFQASFDAKGNYFIGDVGEDRRDEIDLGFPGANYGWPLKEGSLDFWLGDPALSGLIDINGLILKDPLYEYNHFADSSALTGGLVYGGPLSTLDGLYFFGNYVTNQIKSFATDDLSGPISDVLTWDLFTDGEPLPIGILSFGQGANGDLFIVAVNGIYQLIGTDYAGSVSPVPLPPGLLLLASALGVPIAVRKLRKRR